METRCNYHIEEDMIYSPTKVRSQPRENPEGGFIEKQGEMSRLFSGQNARPSLRKVAVEILILAGRFLSGLNVGYQPTQLWNIGLEISIKKNNRKSRKMLTLRPVFSHNLHPRSGFSLYGRFKLECGTSIHGHRRDLNALVVSLGFQLLITILKYLILGFNSRQRGYAPEGLPRTEHCLASPLANSLFLWSQTQRRIILNVPPRLFRAFLQLITWVKWLRPRSDWLIIVLSMDIVQCGRYLHSYTG